MIIKSKTLGLILFIIIFGGIMLSIWMNLWNTESNKTPIKFSSGEFQGEYNPEDIRGSYTFGDVHELFDIPLEILIVAFNLSGDLDAESFQVNGLESLFGESDFEVGTSSVRLFVAWYKGLPFEISEDIYLPESAVEILIDMNSLDIDQVNYLDNHKITSTDPATIEPKQVLPEINIQTETTDERMIKGKTTFREVMDWGLPIEIIEGILGEKISNPLEKIKDHCLSKGLEFETIKLLLQAEVDKLP